MDDVTKYGPVDGDPITSTEEIPFDKKREFNPDLKPGEERVKQKGEPGTKTITTPTTKNPLTGKKLAKVNQQKNNKTKPVDEITEYGGEETSQAIRMNLIRTHRKVAKRTFQVKPGVKNPDI